MGKIKKILFNRISFTLLLFTVLILAFFVYENYFNLSKVLAKVGSKNITQRDLNTKLYEVDLKGSPETPGKFSNEIKSEVLRVLIENFIIEEEAKKLGINANEEEIKKELNNLPTYNYLNDSQKSLAKKNAKLQVLRKKIEEKVVSFREGKVIVARFDQTPGGENRKYAESLIGSINSDLKTGKISFEDAMKKADNDSKIGANSFFPNVALLSHEFDKSSQETKNGLFGNQEFSDLVFSLKKDQMSDPRAIKQEDKETMFVIIKITGSYDYSSRYLSLEEWLEKKKQDYQAKYLSNIKPLSSTGEKLQNKLAKFVPEAKAAENGKCSGGLTPTGDTYPSALEIRFLQIPVTGGDPIAFAGAKADVRFNPDSPRTTTFEQQEAKKGLCSKKGVYVLPSDNTTPDANSSIVGVTDAAWGTSNANGWITFGYKGCGSSVYKAFSCHCSNIADQGGGLDYYIATFDDNNKANPGYWLKASMSGPRFSGEYPLNGNGAFNFDALPNGITNTMKVYWQKTIVNSRPEVELVSPSNGITIYRNPDGTVKVTLKAKARDRDNDKIKIFIKAKKPYTEDQYPEYLGPYPEGLYDSEIDWIQPKWPEWGEFSVNLPKNVTDLIENGTYEWTAKAWDGKSWSAGTGIFGRQTNGLPSGGWLSAWKFTIKPSSNISGGSICSISLEPQRGAIPLVTQIDTSYTAIITYKYGDKGEVTYNYQNTPPPDFKHSWTDKIQTGTDESGNPVYDTIKYEQVWTYSPLEYSLDVFEGKKFIENIMSGNIKPPATFPDSVSYTFSKEGDYKVVLKISLMQYYRFYKDGKLMESKDTDLGCVQESSVVQARNWRDIDWWEVAP